MKTIEDYIVVEQVDGFVIELKTIITNTFGRFWWKTTETKVVWNPLNDIGKITFGSFFNPPTKAKVYESLEDAKQAIEKFVKYPIYHYAVQQPIFPTREPHSFCETPEEKCTMNYCDDNGCQNRKRESANFPNDESIKQ